MAAHPLEQSGPIHRSGGDVEKHALLLVDSGRELVPVEHKEDLERRMRDALVAVDESVTKDEDEFP